jgi:cell division septal protein FtsQ
MPTPRAPNRKLPQRRPLRARLPSPRAVLFAIGRGLRRAVPALVVVVVLGGVGAGATALYRWLRTSPRFALRDLDVAGNARVATAEILVRAGVAPGENLFGLSPRAIEARILGNPWIAAVEARRHLPDGLSIHIVERQPAAVLLVDGAGLYLADEAGRVFKRAAGAEAAGLTVISGLPRRLFGDAPEQAAALARHGLAVAELWRARERPPIGEVHLAKEGVTLYTLDGAVAIALGRGADAATMRRFDATWAALPPDERAQARIIHLDSRTRPDRVTVSLAEPGTR